MVDRAREHLESKGYDIQLTTMKDDYDVDEEIEKHIWPDVVILQTPCNWMGVP